LPAPRNPLRRVTGRRDASTDLVEGEKGGEDEDGGTATGMVKDGRTR
jgi:hypothetical protein